jgi:hypothetical protein
VRPQCSALGGAALGENKRIGGGGHQTYSFGFMKPSGLAEVNGDVVKGTDQRLVYILVTRSVKIGHS